MTDTNIEMRRIALEFAMQAHDVGRYRGAPEVAPPLATDDQIIATAAKFEAYLARGK